MALDRSRAARLVPLALVGVSITSVQFGAALAATLFPLVGAAGVVALRSAVAAVALGAAARSRPVQVRDDEVALTGTGRWAALRAPVALGVVLAAMNTCVYQALARLPLGVVITLEFLGPLGVALAHSRRRADVVMALAAGAGVVLLTVPGDGGRGRLDAVGVVLALLGALGWALYILLNRELGRRRSGPGLATSALVAAVLVVPAGWLAAGTALVRPHVLLLGIAVGVLSSALPFSLDRLALRHLSPGPYGVLMSVNPAMATLAGLLVLQQMPGPVQLAGTALVVAASAAASVAAGAASRRPSAAATPESLQVGAARVDTA